MARNLILIVSTLALLIVLFVGYIVFLGGPTAEPEPTSGIADIEQAPQDSTPVQIQGVDVPAGGRMCTRIYDERTGRPNLGHALETAVLIELERRGYHESRPAHLKFLHSFPRQVQRMKEDAFVR